MLLPRGSYLAPTTASLAVAGARLIETTYHSGQRLPRHAHAGTYMVVVTDGVLCETALHRCHHLGRGALVWNGAGEPHSDEVSAPATRCVNVELDRDSVAAMTHGRPAETLAYRHAGAAIGAVGELQLALRSSAPDALAAAAAVAELVAIACGVTAAPERRRAWLRPVVDALHGEPCAIPSLAELAALARVHPTHLCRTFRQAMRCSIGEYARRLRADAALQRVMRGAGSLAEVALQCGFADQSHLTRTLRARYGVSPGELRRRSCK